MAIDKCNMNGTLQGKVAVVTGASRGIGEAIAYRFAMEGASVVASARTANPADHVFKGTINETAERIRACGGEAHAIQCNLAYEQERENLIKETQDKYGPVDILVSNAAITFFIPVAEFPAKRYDLMLEVQVKAPFHLAQLVLPSMIERQSGHIINISSGAAFHPQADQPGGHGGTVYGMCKAALERFTTGLAQEQYQNNISVNVISPGLVATPGVVHHKLITDESRARVQPVECIAESVYQLAIADLSMSGRIDHAAEFLEEIKIEPSMTLKNFPMTG